MLYTCCLAKFRTNELRSKNPRVSDQISSCYLQILLVTVFCTYNDIIIFRVTGAGMGFLHKLHIIYLINDVLHNASRKTTLNVKSQLQQVIIPIYCHTFVGESQENQQRCEKVVRIWETNSYFDGDIIQVRSVSTVPVRRSRLLSIFFWFSRHSLSFGHDHRTIGIEYVFGYESCLHHLLSAPSKSAILDLEECNKLLNARNSLPQETGTGQYALQNCCFKITKLLKHE